MSQAELKAVIMSQGNDEEAKRRLKVKNWTVCGLLVAFVVIVYLVALVRMGG